jgi:hypothetical protein
MSIPWHLSPGVAQIAFVKLPLPEKSSSIWMSGGASTAA